MINLPQYWEEKKENMEKNIEHSQTSVSASMCIVNCITLHAIIGHSINIRSKYWITTNEQKKSFRYNHFFFRLLP